MGRKTYDPMEFIESLKANKPNVVYLDRHWWGYHIWFVPKGYKYEDRLVIEGNSKLSHLLAILGELTDMKIPFIVVESS